MLASFVTLDGGHGMMGTKERAFALLCNRSLETLVPADHFYRDLNASLIWPSTVTWSAAPIRKADDLRSIPSSSSSSN